MTSSWSVDTDSARHRASSTCWTYRTASLPSNSLFDAVWRELAEETVREAPIDAAEYAGRLFDRFADNPVAARLANWYRLEGTSVAAVDLVLASTRDKVAAVTKAQEEGLSWRFVLIGACARNASSRG